MANGRGGGRKEGQLRREALVGTSQSPLRRLFYFSFYLSICVNIVCK
jgi:hypothetical protein